MQLSVRSKRELSELRRKSGMDLLAQGMAPEVVAQQLRISLRSAARWAKAMREREQAWVGKPIGRPALLSPEKKGRLREMLERGATANGFASEFWTQACIVELVRREFSIELRKERVWGLVKSLGLL